MSQLRWPKDTSIVSESESYSETWRRPRLGSTEADSLALQFAPPNNDGGFEYDVFLTKLIKESSDGNKQVFKATLWKYAKSGASGKSLPDPVSKLFVVCKVVYSPRWKIALEKEAQNYSALADLQGLTVPKFEGFFVGESQQGLVAVLVTEYGGEPLSVGLQYCDLQTRLSLVQGLMALHHRGFTHGDFEERNLIISRDDQNVVSSMLVDLEKVERHNCCYRTESRCWAFEERPSVTNFGCLELYRAYDAAHLWKITITSFLGAWIPTEWASGTPEELIERVHSEKTKDGLLRLVIEGADEEDMRRGAKRVIEELQVWESDRKRWDTTTYEA